MEKMKDLKDLLKHEVMDLYSAEEQIIEALPRMIQKATDPALKTALQEHLQITENQKTRLDEVQSLLRGKDEKAPESKRGFLSGLFGGGGHKCKGTQGLIEEGEKVMSENMNPEVMDAAIIGCAQKIEHYEICGYGTAKAYALELRLDRVAELLDDTLKEEYDADDRLTILAIGELNEKAERADKGGATSGGSKSARPISDTPGKNAPAKRSSPSKAAAPKASAGRTKGVTKGASKSASSKGGVASKAGASKGRK
ncbi:MAG TPA: ferritin-like domain-containing protein [Flavisolibacter sp.]